MDMQVSEDNSTASSDNLGGLAEKPDVGILDIAHVLQKKILYLTGRKDKEGHPLIICDQFPTFDSYTEEEVNKTVLYLRFTAKLLWDHSKLVVVVNRLNNNWTSVKSIFLSLQKYPEDEVEHILLLKPQGFMQRQFVKNHMKEVQTLTKHKVILLENLSKLEDYIEKMDLPNQFGGCDYFDVTEWVEYTMAVERFQTTYKKVRERVNTMIEIFSKISLMSSVDEIDSSLKQNTQLVDDICSDITCTDEIAKTLTPIVDKTLCFSKKVPSPLEEYNCNQLKVISENLTKLRETVEREWSQHKILLDETRQVCQLEEDYGKISVLLMESNSVLRSKNDIGSSLSEVEELLEEVDYFEEKKRIHYKEGMELKERGLDMVEKFQFYPCEIVICRCNELKQLCHNFDESLSARREMLFSSRSVYSSLDQLEKWCKSAVDLLVSQPLESFNTKEGAKMCLGELDLFMKNKQGINMRNVHQLNSLCKRLGNVILTSKVQDALSRMEEVKGMLEKRELSLKKVGEKPPRPVQPVKALIVKRTSTPTEQQTEMESQRNLPMISKRLSDSTDKEPSSFISPTNGKRTRRLHKKDDDERGRRTRLRKSMKLALKRPLSYGLEIRNWRSNIEVTHK